MKDVGPNGNTVPFTVYIYCRGSLQFWNLYPYCFI